MNNIATQRYVAGETVILEFAITLDHAPYDLTGCDFYYTIRDKPLANGDDPYDTEALMRGDTTNGIIVTDAANGIGQILLDSPETRALPVNIPLTISLRMKNAEFDINDPAGGIIIFEPAQQQRAYL